MLSIFLLHFCATLFMTGVIWIVQWVHYPLFDAVAANQFIDFEVRHSNRITWIVLPPMVTELVTAALLFFYAPAFLPFWSISAIGILTLGTWLSTFFLSVPQHQKLAKGFDKRAHCLLVQTNWVRTACWSLKSVVLIYLFKNLLSSVLSNI